MCCVVYRINNTKAFGEVKALDSFFDTMQHDPEKAYYGLAHVQRATEQKAVDTLLLSDALFRSDDVKTRQMYVQLCSDVKEHGGDVRIFSSLHVSGERTYRDHSTPSIPIPDSSNRLKSNSHSRLCPFSVGCLLVCVLYALTD